MEFDVPTLAKTMEMLCHLGKLMMHQFNEDIGIIAPSMLCQDDGASDLRPIRHAALLTYGKVIQALVQMYPNKLLQIFNALRNENEAESYSVEEAALKQFLECLAIARNVLDRANPERKTTDGSFCIKEAHCLFQCLNTIIRILPSTSNQFEEAYGRIKDTCQSRKFDDAHLGKTVWQILYYVQLQVPQRPKILIEVAENLCSSSAMGFAKDDDEDVRAPSTVYSSITKKTAPEIARLTVSQIVIWLENAEVMIDKLKKEIDALPKLKKTKKDKEMPCPVDAESGQTMRNRKERESKLCYLLMNIMNSLGELALVKLQGNEFA